MPAIARPRRPLSISASHASWSIRFSLRMMISGAPSSRSRLSRLFRLITRRYRSLRSEVANRPPSSCTIGRRSGGITGRTDRIIHSGRLPERRKASIRRSRLMAFLRRWPELVRTSAWRVRDSSSRSIRTMMSRTASAPMPAQKMRPVLAPEPYFSSSWRNSSSPIVISGLEGLDLGAGLLELLLLAGGLVGELLALAAEGLVHRGLEVLDALLGQPVLVGDALSRAPSRPARSRPWRPCAAWPGRPCRPCCRWRR